MKEMYRNKTAKVEGDAEETEVNIASLENEEMLQDGGYDNEAEVQNSVFVEVDGNSMYKATVLKTFNGDVQLSSIDRGCERIHI